jgi:hypothetical protein
MVALNAVAIGKEAEGVAAFSPFVLTSLLVLSSNQNFMP